MSFEKAHGRFERSIGWLAVGILLMISVGGLVQIVPLWYMKSVTEPVAGLKPYGALELTGRDIYLRESCLACHSQQIRPFRAETERYGHYSVAGEFVYDRPFQFGSRRVGPDLARIGARYSDAWHKEHLTDPRSMVPESIMPSYPWLARNPADAASIQAKMKVLRRLGHPYSDEEIAAAPGLLAGKTELDAIVAYLQSLGTAIRTRR
ncbi:MAG: cytochrome-c oxidase, cbb3-type subunit II [Candidatus Eisenbacteria bacterium]